MAIILKRKLLKLSLLALFTLSLTLLFALLAKNIDTISGPREIVLVRLEGTIGNAGGLSSDGAIDKNRVIALAKEIGDDPLVAGAVIKISSPGGDAASTQELVESLKELSGKKPIVTFTTDIAASGGYWLYATGNRTVAAPLSIVGSIGVLSQSIDASGLLEKIGVNFTTIKAGKYKDAGSFSRQMTEEEMSQFQELVDKVHEEFVSDISELRGIPKEALYNLSEGQIFLGKDAVAFGLADEVGFEDNAIELAKKMTFCESCLVTEVSLSTGWERMMSGIFSGIGRSFGTGLVSGIFEARKQV